MLGQGAGISSAPIESCIVSVRSYAVGENALTLTLSQRERG